MRKIIGAAMISLIFILSATAQDTELLHMNFRAVVGDKEFDCREKYSGIGTTGSEMTFSDVKFYVSDIRLLDKKGKEIPVELANDGKFQTDKVALIDLEDGSGTCSNGTKETNRAVVIKAPKGKFSGVKFVIGVPEELNHLDPTLQPSPLNITRMMWSWQLGFKFARIDTRTTGRPNGYVLHLGSTNCTRDNQGEITCARPNRPEFVFERFDLKKDVVTFDLKALFAGANVDINQEKTSAGCMSFEGDSDCLPVFANLGLSFEGSKPGKQTVLRVERLPQGTAKR